MNKWQNSSNYYNFNYFCSDERDDRPSENIIHLGNNNIEENVESFNHEENNMGVPEISQRQNEPEEVTRIPVWAAKILIKSLYHFL